MSDNQSSEQSNEKELGVHMANEIIILANDKLETGLHPLVIADALRHAAANFTAFAFAHGTDDVLDRDEIVRDFVQMLEYYDSRHREGKAPISGLEQLVEQVKNE
ncbi:MAG: DUF3144 domain-containing protein [Rhodospirillales bacterium]|nr:DUF3144 domain-containing protein [Rhodospirillales bacterium]